MGKGVAAGSDQGCRMNIFEILGFEHQLISNALQLARAYARRMAYPGAVAEPEPAPAVVPVKVAV